ncbi:MAG: 2-hydroxyglutaryl-CoA dehydratase [Firmicutes bacterium]|nr:2-hydroxyglutaryl-CoA dehydratase [Bacillota bacterium]
MEFFLGIDIGSVSTNLVLIDKMGQIKDSIYLKTCGNPIGVLQEGLRDMARRWPDSSIGGVGATGSGRRLAGVIIGADVVKNEITAHAVAALQVEPGVKTVLEIGGQDSKIILLRDGIVTDFAMNTVCAAGTGSFLDRQAARLGIPIEEFGQLALKAELPVQIAGRCAVFAESDMIHKQQLGHKMEDLLLGLCKALVRNYLANVAKGKDIKPPVLFQGGVAANLGMKLAFEKELGLALKVPSHYDVMGALGAALLAQGAVRNTKTSFRGFSAGAMEYRVAGFTCPHCANACEIVEIFAGPEALARWGGRCGRWDRENNLQKN